MTENEEKMTGERRRQPPYTLAEAIEILECRLDDRIILHLQKHSVEEQSRQECLIAQMRQGIEELRELIKSGFPDGDPSEHRRAHEEMIRWVQARRRFLESLAEKLATGGIWALLVFLAVASWHYFKNSLGQGG